MGSSKSNERGSGSATVLGVMKLHRYLRLFVCVCICMSVLLLKTRSSAIAEEPRDASCQLKSCQLPRNSAETTYTTSPDQTDGMKLEI